MPGGANVGPGHADLVCVIFQVNEKPLARSELRTENEAMNGL